MYTSQKILYQNIYALFFFQHLCEQVSSGVSVNMKELITSTVSPVFTISLSFFFLLSYMPKSEIFATLPTTTTTYLNSYLIMYFVQITALHCSNFESFDAVIVTTRNKVIMNFHLVKMLTIQQLLLFLR